MKLEVGMYVRTKNGEIGKLEELYCQDSYEHSVRMKINGYYDSYLLKEIDFEKASNNIIDLIEVGDYVNGYPVAYITDLGNEFGKRLSFGNENYVLSSKFNLDKIYIYEEDIKSIVTKEMFESMSYKVGD